MRHQDRSRRDPDKQVNEDAAAYVETRFGHLCVVCDGMGGHEGGREASNLALQVIIERVETAPDNMRPRDILKGAIEEANRRVHGMSRASALGHPGSTVVAILVHAGGTEVAHVGDSRAYLIHHGVVHQVTRDHSMVQEMVNQGILTPEQAQGHPDANKITRALGMEHRVEVEARPEPLFHAAGDVFVLCSDGLSDLVNAADIGSIAGSEPTAQSAPQLVDLANARGGYDNVTALVIRTRESATGARVSGDLPATMAQTLMQTPDAAYGAPPPMHYPQESAPPRSVIPSSTGPRSERAKLHPAALAGVFLAFAGIGIALIALYIELHARRHEKVVAPLATSVPMVSTTANALAPDAAPMNLVPDVPDAGPPPAATLVPAPPTTR